MPLFSSSPANAANLAGNIMNSGNGGAMNNGSTGECPDGYQTFIASLGAGSAVAGSIVTEDDKRKYKIDITGTERTTTFTRKALTGALVAGKTYYVIAEVDIDATECDQFMIDVKIRDGSNAALYTARALRHSADNAAVPEMNYNGVMRTPEFIAPVGSDNVILDLFVATFTATIKIGRIEFRQVD